MSHVDVPPALRRNVLESWGAAGERWLGELPGLLDAVVDAWSLVVEAPYVLSFNWVAAVRRADGSPAVLKLGVPSSEHLAEEAAALTSFAGAGAVRLLDRDAGRGALLLERAHPGTMLRDLVPARDEEATAVAVGILRRLHVEPAAGGPLPDLVRYGGAFRRLPREHPLLPRRLVDRADRLFDELCATAPARVVLHGDLHHGNILRAGREPWLAIDPHGVIGDPGYELAPLLYNPDPRHRDDGLLALVPARLEQLADGLGIPLDRAVAWGFVGSVLSEVWTAEGGGTPGGRPLDVARLLEPRLP
ncbi:aminoglycoside phosphotransferase family protein [Actinophytocola sp.]|uniref:aminoglycoside phosphotransferase family protein n=1 Tax=Actinophytocola sp. TaxID=1872138 RepID=UPI002ED89477